MFCARSGICKWGVNLNVFDRLVKCEIEYIKNFCTAEVNQKIIKFCDDDIMHDMHATNYTWIKNADNDDDLIRLIEAEIEHSKRLNKDFCMIACHVPLNIFALNMLSVSPSISTSGYYVFDCNHEIPKIPKNDDVKIIRASSPEMIDDILTLDIEHEGENPDIDFCKRRLTRRKDIYLSDKGVDTYLCYYKSNAVGNCDLFISNGVAKIEEFAVSPSNQGKGFGAALLCEMMEIAVNNNVKLIYLGADENDTVKNMYQKFGFTKVHEFIELEFTV